MIVKGIFEVLGATQKVNKAGQPYALVSVLQGTESKNLMYKDMMKAGQLTQYTRKELIFTLDILKGRYDSNEIIDFDVPQEKK